MCSPHRYLRFSYSFRPRGESATFLFATVFVNDLPDVSAQIYTRLSGCEIAQFLVATRPRLTYAQPCSEHKLRDFRTPT